MRQPVFEYEAWVMMLSFPLDYQTDHYVNKAVSLFGKLLIWHRPRVKKSCVLVKVFINEVALVPRSLVVKRISVLGGIGRSWTVPIYILNGRYTNSLLVSTEEDAPPLNASPHSYSLPYLTVAQQHHLEVQAWQQQQQQVNLAWMGNAQTGHEGGLAQGNGWGMWPEVPQEFVGYNFRHLFQYEGSSMMDGVADSDNTSDDPLEAWNEYAEVEAAADRIEHGIVGVGLSFVREGGNFHDLFVPEIDTFLAFVGRMIRSVNTRRILHVDPMYDVSFASDQSISMMLRGLFESLGQRALIAVLRGPYLNLSDLSDVSARATHSVTISELQDDDTAWPAALLSDAVVEEELVISDTVGADDLILPLSNISLMSSQVLQANFSGVASDSLVLSALPPPEPLLLAPAPAVLAPEAPDAQAPDDPAPAAPVAPAPVAAHGRGRGRGRRQPTPATVVAVCRSPRLHNAGYVHEEYPESSRASSSTAKADVPAILQIKELQRIGVEHCHIPLEELSEDRMLKEHED
jgi:hypothetical protein